MQFRVINHPKPFVTKQHDLSLKEAILRVFKKMKHCKDLTLFSIKSRNCLLQWALHCDKWGSDLSLICHSAHKYKIVRIRILHSEQKSKSSTRMTNEC